MHKYCKLKNSECIGCICPITCFLKTNGVRHFCSRTLQPTLYKLSKTDKKVHLILTHSHILLAFCVWNVNELMKLCQLSQDHCSMCVGKGHLNPEKHYHLTARKSHRYNASLDHSTHPLSVSDYKLNIGLNDPGRERRWFLLFIPSYHQSR